MDKKLVIGSAAFFSLVLPLFTKLGNIGIILLLVSASYYIVKNKNKGYFNLKNVYKLLFETTAVLVVLLTIGLLFTDDIGYAVKHYENFASYMLIPLFFSFLDKDVLFKMKKTSFTYFVIGCVLSSIILLSYNFFKFLSNGNSLLDIQLLFSYEYTYHDFASLLKFHPSLLGVYLVFALVVLTETKSLFVKELRIGFYAILLLCLIFLNSRAPFLLLGCYVAIYFGRLLVNVIKGKVHKKKLFVNLTMLAIVFFGGVYMLKDTYIIKRFTGQLVWELTENKGTTYDGVYVNDSRMARWIALVDIAKDQPYFGYGSRSEDKMVLQAYKKHNLMYALDLKYGPHNQYLSFLIEYGLFGLMLFGYFLFCQFRLAMRSKSIIFFSFTLFVALTCIFDSVLYLNTCVIFVAYFSNLFTFLYWKKETV